MSASSDFEKEETPPELWQFLQEYAGKSKADGKKILVQRTDDILNDPALCVVQMIKLKKLHFAQSHKKP